MRSRARARSGCGRKRKIREASYVMRKAKKPFVSSPAQKSLIRWSGDFQSEMDEGVDQPTEINKTKPSGHNRIHILKSEARDESPSLTSSRRASPSLELTEEQKQKLERITNRRSFKVPMSMKNLLNNNGLDSEKKEILMAEKAQAKLELEDPVAAAAAPKPKPKKNVFRPPRDLLLDNAPTEPVRSGYLARFDAESADLGEDAWLTQFVSLDVPSASMELFSEVMG